MTDRIQWGAELMRLTTFQEKPSTDGAWKLVTGEEPDTFNRNNRAQAFEEAGQVSELNLKHIALVGRDDWLVTPLLPNDSTTIRSFAVSEGVKVLDQVVERWLGSQDPAPIRLAFGAVLSDAPAKDRADGYNRLGAFIKDVKLDARSEDFTYQINWPRQSRVADIKINRLTKWAVTRRTSQPIGMFTGQRVTFGEPTSIVFQVQLELDLSTDGGRVTSLPREKLGELWSELTSLGVEISEEGNIP